MLKSARKLAPRVHLPLRRLALCLDCDECFEIGYDACPACGSKTWTSLARFLEMGRSESISRLVEGIIEETPPAKNRHEDRKASRQTIVVARDRLSLYDHLRRAFAGNETVRVVLDRRVEDRRVAADGSVPERRRASRRVRRPNDKQLNAMGWAVVVMDSPDQRRR